MTYKQNGEELFFNSSGMFDIQGEYKGESVEIRENKSMTIDYALAKENEGIEFYYLDPESNEWDEIQHIQTKEELAEEKEEILKLRFIQK